MRSRGSYKRAIIRQTIFQYVFAYAPTAVLSTRCATLRALYANTYFPFQRAHNARVAAQRTKQTCLRSCARCVLLRMRCALTRAIPPCVFSRTRARLRVSTHVRLIAHLRHFAHVRNIAHVARCALTFCARVRTCVHSATLSQKTHTCVVSRTLTKFVTCPCMSHYCNTLRCATRNRIAYNVLRARTQRATCLLCATYPPPVYKNTRVCAHTYILPTLVGVHFFIEAGSVA